MAVANFGYDAFDFLPSSETLEIWSELLWSNPVDRTGANKNRRAVKAVHQYCTIAEEQTVRFRFTCAPAAFPITDWAISAFLTQLSGIETGTPVQTVTIGSGIEVQSTPEGIFDVSLSFKAEDDVPQGGYVLSVYRTNPQQELSKTFIQVGPTGIEES